ncbi:MAG: hypothetical protein ABSB35_13765, partial [Bryobacteraceae bacterium]
PPARLEWGHRLDRLLRYSAFMKIASGFRPAGRCDLLGIDSHEPHRLTSHIVSEIDPAQLSAPPPPDLAR